MPRSAVPTCLLALCPALLLAQQPERYALTGDSIAIYNLVGDVRLEPGGQEVTVQLLRHGAEGRSLRVVQGEIRGRSTLRIVYPGERVRSASPSGHSRTTLRVRDDGTFGDDAHRRGRDEGRRVTIESGAGLDARADLVIRIPKGGRMMVALASGTVAVKDVDGEVAVDAREANVTASGTSGRLTIDVGSGAVRVTRARGDLSVDTGSGSVEVSGFDGSALGIDTGSGEVSGSDLRADQLSINTGSGEIRLDAVTSPRLSLETGSGGITAELRRDITSLSAETGSGDIAIRAPATLGATLEIETSSGDIESDFPLQVTRQSRDHVVGTIGDGRGTIAIETGSGRIRLLKSSP